MLLLAFTVLLTGVPGVCHTESASSTTTFRPCEQIQERHSEASKTVQMVSVMQGVAGSIPFQALVFFTLYFQLLGFSNFAASALMSGFLFATAFGGLLGGWIGDK